METKMDENVAPVADEPQIQNEETNETVEQNEQPEQVEAQEPSQNQSEPIAEGAEAPEQVEDTSDDFNPAAYADYMPRQQNDIPITEDGSVDPVAWKEQLKAEMREEMRFEQQEAKAWNKIEKKYGEQLTPTRRKLILNSRVASALEGKGGSLDKLADEVMGEFTAAKSQGKADATTSRKVQKAVGLETSSNNTGQSKESSLTERIANDDPSAATELFASWIADGKI